MEPTKTIRKRRTDAERIADYDAKIEKHKADIKKLEEKKHNILNKESSKERAKKIKEIVDKAKDNGLSAEEIAEKLGITIE